MEHHGAHFTQQLAQLFAPLLAVGGEEALKGKAACRQTRHRQCRDAGAAAGNALHSDAVFGAQPHQILTRIADGRRTGIRYQSADLAAQQTLYDGLAGGGAVMLVIAHQRLFDVEVVEKLHRHPGVFGGNEVCFAQRFHGAGGEVTQIADGGGHQI